MQNEIYNRFGARVSFARGGEGLFLVVSGAGDPEPRVRVFGGQIVMRLNKTKILARLELTKALELLKEPGIRKVGGVHLDVERYKRFLDSQANAHNHL